jgi:hypothetical protein
LLPIVVCAIAIVGNACVRHKKADVTTSTRPPTSTNATSTNTVTTLALAPAKGLTLDQFITRFSHSPETDRTLLANNGFLTADVVPKGNNISVITLHFQGRDGASETMTVLHNDGLQRKNGADFKVDEVSDSLGVRWLEEGRSTGPATIEQVLFASGTSLVIVEAVLPAGTTSTADVRAAAKKEAA